MSLSSNELADRLDIFNQGVMAFVKEIPENDWHTQCPAEEWPVGVVARHIGAGHYESVELAKMMIAGKAIDGFTMDRIVAKANAHAEAHADCTREEVLSILETKGRQLVEFVRGLSDADLECSQEVAEFGGPVTVQVLLKVINLKSAGGHLESMQKTLAQSV